MTYILCVYVFIFYDVYGFDRSCATLAIGTATFCTPLGRQNAMCDWKCSGSNHSHMSGVKGAAGIVFQKPVHKVDKDFLFQTALQYSHAFVNPGGIGVPPILGPKMVSFYRANSAALSVTMGEGHPVVRCLGFISLEAHDEPVVDDQGQNMS